MDRHTKIISIRWVIKADKFSIAVKCVIQKFFTGTTKILKLNWDRELRVFHSPKKVLKFLENFVNFSNSFCQVVFWNSISRFKKGVIETVRWWRTLIGHFQENFFPRWTVQKFCCRRPNFEQNIFEIWSQNLLTKNWKFYRDFAKENFCDRQTNRRTQNFLGIGVGDPLLVETPKSKKKSFLIIS